MNASEFASVNDKLVTVANTGLEHARTTHLLEIEVDKLRVVEHLVDRKHERTRLCFEELRSNLKSSG